MAAESAGAYVQVSIQHKVKAKEVEEANPTVELVPHTVEAGGHDRLHPPLCQLKSHTIEGLCDHRGMKLSLTVRVVVTQSSGRWRWRERYDWNRPKSQT